MVKSHKDWSFAKKWHYWHTYTMPDFFRRIKFLLKFYLRIKEEPMDVCHCGEDEDGHNYDYTHSFIPMNCNCGYHEPHRCPVHPGRYRQRKKLYKKETEKNGQ